MPPVNSIKLKANKRMSSSKGASKNGESYASSEWLEALMKEPYQQSSHSGQLYVSTLMAEKKVLVTSNADSTKYKCLLVHDQKENHRKPRNDFEYGCEKAFRYHLRKYHEASTLRQVHCLFYCGRAHGLSRKCQKAHLKNHECIKKLTAETRLKV